MPDIREHQTATAAGTLDIGGELTVNRMGFGAMRLTGPGVWGEPRDPDEDLDGLEGGHDDASGSSAVGFGATGFFLNIWSIRSVTT